MATANLVQILGGGGGGGGGLVLSVMVIANLVQILGGGRGGANAPLSHPGCVHDR